MAFVIDDGGGGGDTTVDTGSGDTGDGGLTPEELAALLGKNPSTAHTWNGNGPSGYGTYILNPDGSLGAYIGNPQAPKSGGSTSVTIHNTPIQSQGGRYHTAVDTDGSITGYPGATYQEDTYDGSITVINKNAGGGGGDSRDRNGDGYDDTTGYPVGVSHSGSYEDGTPILFYHGIRVNPDGSPMSDAQMAQHDKKDKNSQVIGSATGGYYERQPDGTWKMVVRPTSSSSGGGGGSSGGSRVSSGGGGGGGGSSSSNRSGGYNNTNLDTVIHQGGFADTNFNTSDIGPNALANDAANRALQGLQTAGGLAAQLQKIKDDRISTIINNLSNPSDIVAREYSVRGLTNPGDKGGILGPGGGGITGYDDTTLQALIDKLSGGGGGGGDFGGGGINYTPPPPAGGSVGTGGGGDVGSTTPGTPAPTTPTDPLTAQYGAPPEGFNSWQDWLKSNGPGWLNSAIQSKGEGQQGIDWNDPNIVQQMGPWIQQYLNQKNITPEQAAQQQRVIESMNPWGNPGGYMGFLHDNPQAWGAHLAADTPGTEMFINSYQGGGAPTGAQLSGGIPLTAAQIANGWSIQNGKATQGAPQTPEMTPTKALGYYGNGDPYIYDLPKPPGPLTGSTTTQPKATTQPTASQAYSGVPNSQVAGLSSGQGSYVTTGTGGKSTIGDYAGFKVSNPNDPTKVYGPNTIIEPGTPIYLEKLAHGGITRASHIITGDPQADGKPNPEMVITPPGTPKRVIPMRNMTRNMPMMRRGMPGRGVHPMPNLPASRMLGPRMMQAPQQNPQDINAQGMPAFAYGTDYASNPQLSGQIDYGMGGSTGRIDPNTIPAPDMSWMNQIDSTPTQPDTSSTWYNQTTKPYNTTPAQTQPEPAPTQAAAPPIQMPNLQPFPTTKTAPAAPTQPLPPLSGNTSYTPSGTTASSILNDIKTRDFSTQPLGSPAPTPAPTPAQPPAMPTDPYSILAGLAQKYPVTSPFDREPTFNPNAPEPASPLPPVPGVPGGPTSGMPTNQLPYGGMWWEGGTNGIVDGKVSPMPPDYKIPLSPDGKWMWYGGKWQPNNTYQIDPREAGGMGGTNGTGGGPSGEGGGNRGTIDAAPPSSEIVLPGTATTVDMKRAQGLQSGSWTLGSDGNYHFSSYGPDDMRPQPDTRFLGPPTQAPNPNTPPSYMIKSYGDEAYKMFPALQYILGNMDKPTYMGMAKGNSPGAFGTAVPFGGDINYTRALDIMNDPDSYAALGSLYKAANLNLTNEVNRARRRAPLGQALRASEIMT